MYDFKITVTAPAVYQLTGTKEITQYDQRDGAYSATVEVTERFATWELLLEFIHKNPGLNVKQVVEVKDRTSNARAQTSYEYKD